MTLAAADAVKDFLQDQTIADDDLTYALEHASSLIEEEVGRELETTGDQIYVFDGRLRHGINLPHWPLASIVSVTEDETALDATDYQAELARGRVDRLNSSGFVRPWDVVGPVTIVYTTAIPTGLAELCARIAARIYSAGVAGKNLAQMHGLKQLTVSRWSGTAAGDDPAAGPSAAAELTDAEARICERYRDR